MQLESVVEETSSYTAIETAARRDGDGMKTEMERVNVLPENIRKTVAGKANS